MTTRIKISFLIITIAFLSLFSAWLLYPDYMSDDAFIHAGFINGLIKHHGFYFGNNLTYGTSSPFWTLICAVFVKLTSIPAVMTIRLLSGLFTFMSIYGFYLLLKRVEITPFLIVIAVFSLAFNGYLLRWYLTGMEVGATIFLIIFGFYLFLGENNKKNSIFTGLLMGCATIARPEAILFLIIFILCRIIFYYKNKLNLSLFLISGTLPLVSWNLFAYFHFGTIIPNSYLLKARNDLFSFTFSNIQRTIKLLISGNFPEFFLLIILLTIVIRLLIKNKKLDIFNIIKPELLIVSFCFLGFYSYYILKDVVVISRYSVTLTPMIILFTAVAANFYYFKLKRGLILPIIWIIVIILYNSFFTFIIIKPSTDEFSDGFQKTYKEIALYLKDINSDKTIGLTDVGIIGTYSGMNVADFAGLVDHRRFSFYSVKDYIEYRKPDYIILRGEYKINKILPKNTSYTSIFQKNIKRLGINDVREKHSVILWNIYWH